jgi:hypothetical protein
MSEWKIPVESSVSVSPAKEAFTNALIGVTITILVYPDGIDRIDDRILRDSARRVYDGAYAAALEEQANV